jgi:hypothetical protein
MGLPLRLLLLVIFTFIFTMVVRGIRKGSLELSDSVYWLTLAICLLACALFPGIVAWTAHKLGFISPANMAFLLGVVALLVRVFQQDQKICALRQKLTKLVQSEALAECGAYSNLHASPDVSDNGTDKRRDV